jgi:hypothetical protein
VDGSQPVARPRMPAAERRAAILEAATTEFAETGLAGTRLEAIAARAGISHPPVVQMFGSKSAFFLADALPVRSFFATGLVFTVSTVLDLPGRRTDTAWSTWLLQLSAPQSSD